MLKNILSLEGVSLLSKGEQKNVNGGAAEGGSCCVIVVGNVGSSRHCGYSKSEAKAEASLVASWDSGVSAYWCCASC
jgi:hypothetical protein